MPCHHHSGKETASQRANCDVVITAAEQNNGDQRTGVSTHVETDHIRATEWITGNRLEDGTAHAERAA